MRAMAVRESDAQLVQRVRGGSLSALGELYERHGDLVYRAAYALLGRSADAEDVLQDVFVGLPLRLDRYDERGNFGAWLRAVAVRAALMVRRRRERSVPWSQHLHAAIPSGMSNCSDTDPTSRIAVQRALAGLPEALRVVFVLREVEGYSHREIGALLGISATASGIRLHRAWKQLRKELGIR